MGRASESVESNEFHAFAINRMADRRPTSHVDIPKEYRNITIVTCRTLIDGHTWYPIVWGPFQFRDVVPFHYFLFWNYLFLVFWHAFFNVETRSHTHHTYRYPSPTVPGYNNNIMLAALRWEGAIAIGGVKSFGENPTSFTHMSYFIFLSRTTKTNTPHKINKHSSPASSSCH